MEKEQIRRGQEVERSAFEIISKEDRNYTLFSEKYKKEYQVKIYTYGIELNVSDIIEMPDEMTICDKGHSVLTERLIQFCEPNNNMSIPKDFNIELDYAYVTYKSTGEKILVQRCYG